MSTPVASLDLHSPSSPRSLCAWPASPPTSSSNTNSNTNNPKNPFDNNSRTNNKNPFDDAAASTSSYHASTTSSGVGSLGAYAIVYGTERGSLHYRCYPGIDKHGQAIAAAAVPMMGGGMKSPSSVGGGGSRRSMKSGGSRTIPPLGLDGGAGSGVHPVHQPVDLNGAVPGSVVTVLRASSSPIPIFLLLVDDNRGSAAPSSASPGAYAAHLVSLRHGIFTKLGSGNLPRMSSAAFHPVSGFVYAAGTGVTSLPHSATAAIALAGSSSETNAPRHSQHQQQQSSSSYPTVSYNCTNGLSSAARSGQSALALVCDGKVAVVAVNNTFYAVPSIPAVNNPFAAGGGGVSGDAASNAPPAKKFMSFTQSSQVHPAIVVPISPSSSSSSSSSTSLLFLASGRECATLEIQYDHRHNYGISFTPPKHGIATLASPILSACSIENNHSGSTTKQHNSSSSDIRLSGVLVAVLTSDGLVHTRSPSCIAIPLKTVEVGNRPNNFFALSNLPKRRLLAVAYSGDARVVVCKSDTSQDLADRLMKLSIDAFGVNGFPRGELAEALNASFSAASYVGPEPSIRTRILLRQYLEATLGLDDDHDSFSNNNSRQQPIHHDNDHNDDDDDDDDDSEDSDSVIPRGAFDNVNNNNENDLNHNNNPPLSPAFLTGVALLCLVSTQLTPPNSTLAIRAAKACASRSDNIANPNLVSSSVVKVCDLISDKLLTEASNSISLLDSSRNPIVSSNKSSKHARRSAKNMEFVEASVWLLRSCGRHERAIEILQQRMSHSGSSTNLQTSGTAAVAASSSSSEKGGGWSLIKYESYTAAHLGELWSSGDDDCASLVIRSSATTQLLEQNPEMGLSVFTSSHPSNEREWKEMIANDDPLCHAVDPRKVVGLLKSIQPSLLYGSSGVSTTNLTSSSNKNDSRKKEQQQHDVTDGSSPIPLNTGRALAVTYLESAIGISSNRPILEDAYSRLAPDQEMEERSITIHDELAYILLEGVIKERGDDDSDRDTSLGLIYRAKLRRLLSWPNSKCRAERILASLPASFLREHALLLGKLGRHEDALRILYCDLHSLELALEYCDARHEFKLQKMAAADRAAGLASDHHHPSWGGGRDAAHQGYEEDACTYLPLVRVALESDTNAERGISAAIQVLSLRRDAIDRGAALRLLPENLPVSAVARPFLIPALVDSESQVRRLKVAASLLRARYVELKRSLTEAQISSQAALHTVPALQSLNLGNPLPSASKPFKARPSHNASPHFPDVIIIKHFFPRYMVIQAKVTNTSSSSSSSLEGRTLGDVAFVVAESSEDAIHPTVQVPLKTLPPNATGSAWCALSASPARLDETALLTCELRYTILAVDAATGAPLSFSGGGATAGGGRTYVEELQDIQVRPMEFLH